MPNLNRVMLMGNLTRDPELRRTPKGTAVCDIGLAINRYYSRDDGQRGEDTTFVDVTLWGRQAEVVAEYCGKGRPLYVEGRLNLDSWEDRNTGQQRTKLKVVGETVQLLGDRQGGGGGGGGGGYQQSAPPQQQQYQQSAPPQQYQQQYQQQAPPQQSYSPPPQQASPPPGASGAPSDEDEEIPF